MPHDNWDRIQEIFLKAADLGSPERTAFLERACHGDSSLRAEVDSLLRADSAPSRLDEAIGSEAASLIGQPLSGARLGAYRVLEEMGRGGMGTVYLAERDDDQFRKQVAIKVVKRGMDTDEVLSRFRHERQILASLEHPYVARLLDGGTTPDGRPFFVMERVQGQPIDAYCRSHNLDVKARLQLFLRVCEAVSYAHRALVVHRDLKPGNILVTAGGVPKLLDFGVAKLLDPVADPGFTATLYGSRPLTPEYSSPEQVRGLPVTTATDVYALGTILYELLTRERAQQIDTNTPAEIDRVVCETEPPRPSLAVRGLNADLDNIVLMAMRKEPERRYASVDQFAADIQRHLDGRPVIARQDSFTYRAGKFIRRHRLPVVAAALVFASLIVGVAVSVHQARQAEAERQVADIERARAEAERQRALASQRDAEREAAIADRQRADAELQRTAAETQRQLADRRFAQVRELAGKFVVEFHDAIAKLPGSTPARKMVVETGLQYYDSLAREAAGNRDLMEEVARGYDRLGDVQGNPYYPNFGDLVGALGSYKKSLAIRDRISDPSSAFLRDRILGGVRMAQILTAQGDLPAAERSLREAISKGAASSDYQVLDALRQTYNAMAGLKMSAAKYNEATEVLWKQLEISERLAREGREPLEEQRGISLAHTKLGDVLASGGHDSEALDHLRVALEIDKRLASADPNNLLSTRKLYITYVMMGRVYRGSDGRRLASPEEAAAAHQAAAALADKMAAADSNNNLAVTDVAVAQSALGDLLRQQNQMEAAVASYRKLVDAAERLNRDGAQVFSNVDMGVQAHHRLGVGLVKIGHAAEALEEFRKAENYLVILEKLNPGLRRNSLRKAEILSGRAEALNRERNWKEASAAFISSIAIYEAEYKSNPNDASMLNGQPALYAVLADCYAAAREWSAAAQAARTALERYREIEAKRPLAEQEQAERAGTLQKLTEWSQ
jgi:serine/threonine protein kinase/tetratricopeptide (TPR) repeat protein